MGYTDDLDIAGRSLRAIKEASVPIERKARRVGLIINEEKTKFLVISRTQTAQKRIGPVLYLEGYRFEVVNQFTYLGSIITSDNESMEIKQRLNKANKAFGWQVY